MSKIFDTSNHCKLLFNGPTQNESALILLRSKLSVIVKRLGISERKGENILLVASEMVSNNIKHAKGRGLIQVWAQPGPVLDILSLDWGPGIENLGLAEVDGFSTSNTLGKGLGSIRRLSDESFIYTQPESGSEKKKWNGTIMLARFFNENSPDEHEGVKFGLYSRSLSDSHHNGDRIYIQKEAGKFRWLHLDGLGHGEDAELATANLSSHFAHFGDLLAVLDALDRQLTATRGAVGVIGEIDPAQAKLHLLGVGDMHAHILGSEEMYNLSFPPGIIGRQHRTSQLFSSDFGKKNLVVTASDGIRRNWDTSNFPGLFNQHPQLIAYTLGNIMGRISDDQSLCVSSIE